MNYDVSVYPNPSNGSFNLRMPKLENVESIILFNALGQKMEELNLAKYSNGEISFGESLKKGFYLLNVVINGKKQTMPIIKN
ncbi:MAG: T9SS type A sorting domain-containing protein [bacterium]|nr:T9SS type A sorting domain-containing protein [bacterium]